MSEALPTAAGNVAPSSTTNQLDDRYGIKRKGKFDRRFAWGAAIALVLSGLVYLVVSGWEETGQVEFQDLHFTSASEYEGTIKFMVSGPPNEPVACAVEALSTSKATVAWKVIMIPASEQRSHTITTKVFTTSEATAGYVRSCWVVEDA